MMIASSEIRGLKPTATVKSHSVTRRPCSRYDRGNVTKSESRPEPHVQIATIESPQFDRLADLTNLESLDLRRTKVTAAGISELKAALPKCQIQWDEMSGK